MNGLISVIIIGITCLFWVFVFGRAFLHTIRNTKVDFRGRNVTGKIINVTQKGSRKRLSIEVEFPNLSGQDVIETILLKDDQPELNRYEVGNSIALNLNEDDPKLTFVRLADRATTGKRTRSTIAFGLLVASIIGTYFMFRIIYNEVGGDWSRVYGLKTQDGLAITGTVFVFSIVFMYVVFKAIKLIPSKNQAAQIQELKMYGYRATASITNIEETGVKINDRPMIRFQYEFKDNFGNVHNGQDKMVLGLLEIAKIGEVNEKDILYLKNDPKVSKLLDSMKASPLSGCTKLIYLFIAAVYTIVIFSMFLSGIAFN